jgi:hypothetical protein
MEPTSPGGTRRLAQAIVQQAPVRQAGQAVVVGDEAAGLLRAAQVADIRDQLDAAAVLQRAYGAAQPAAVSALVFGGVANRRRGREPGVGVAAGHQPSVATPHRQCIREILDRLAQQPQLIGLAHALSTCTRQS